MRVVPWFRGPWAVERARACVCVCVCVCGKRSTVVSPSSLTLPSSSRPGGRIVPICDLGDAEAAAVRRGVAVLRTAGARVLHYTHTRIANYPNGTEKACCECCEDLPYVLSRVDNATRNFPLDGIFTDNAVANEAWRDGYYSAIAARVHRQNRTLDPDTVAATKRWYGMNENCAHCKYPPHMRTRSPAARHGVAGGCGERGPGAGAVVATMNENCAHHTHLRVPHYMHRCIWWARTDAFTPYPLTKVPTNPRTSLLLLCTSLQAGSARCAPSCEAFGHTSAQCSDCQTTRCSKMTEAYFDLADVHLLSEGTANRADGGPDPDYVTAFPFAATDAIRNKMSMFTYNATSTQWKGMIDAAAKQGFSKFYVHHKLTTGFVTLPPWFEEMVDYIAAMNGGGEVQGLELELGQGTTAAASSTDAVLPLPQTFHLTPNGSTASSPPLLNPNRGFRMQIDNACLPGKAGQDDLEKGLATCKMYNLTVTLMYCYLTRFWNVSQLPDAFLHTDLPQRFASLRKAGVTAILNFGYMDGKANFSMDVEPYSFEPIRGHIAQMAPVIRAHADMVRTWTTRTHI